MMPIRVELIRENRAVLQTYIDPLDNSDLIALKNTMIRDIFPLTEGKLHIIADFRAVKNLPSMTLSSGSAMLRMSKLNIGHVICITQNSFVATIVRIFGSLTPKNPMTIVSSLEEAYKEVDILLAKST